MNSPRSIIFLPLRASLLSMFFAPMFTAQRADAAISITIYESGTDLVMTATGTYDFTGAATATGPGLGATVVLSPATEIYGWETGAGPTSYSITVAGSLSFGGPLAGDLQSDPTTVVSTTNPFYVAPDPIIVDEYQITFANSAPA